MDVTRPAIFKGLLRRLGNPLYRKLSYNQFYKYVSVKNINYSSKSGELNLIKFWVTVWVIYIRTDIK